MYSAFHYNTYIQRAESLVSYVHKFLYNNESYVQVLGDTWQSISNTYFSLPYSTRILDDFLSLYSVTGNTNYLNEAVQLHNFIDSYFFDIDHWGYFTNLATNKAPLDGFGRSPGYYLDFAYDLLHFYLVTYIPAYLSEGLNIINRTISLAYQDSLGYFYSFFNANDNTNPYTNYRVYIQMKILTTLLAYLTNPNINITSYKTYFMKSFNNSLQILEKFGFQNNYYTIYEFDQNGNPIDSEEVLSQQIALLNLYSSMKKNDWNLTNFEQNILDNSFSFFTKFYNQQTKLFFMTTTDSSAQFGANFEALRGIINLNQYFNVSSDYSIFNTNFSSSNSIFGLTDTLLISGFFIIIVIATLIFYISKKMKTIETPTKKLQYTGTTSNYSLPINFQLCDYCGEKASEMDVFCHNCGHRIKE